MVTEVVRVGYLVTDYPALSHAFIEREVRALRACGVQVITFSVRPAAASSLRSELDKAAAATTTALRGSGRSVWLQAHLRWLARHPKAYLVGLKRAVTTGRWTPRARLWQLFYFVQAVLLADLMRAESVRHLHVHLANNAADIGRLAVTIANAREPGSHSWSLAMHGPTEFADPVRFDLAAKARSAAFVACISRYARDRVEALVGSAHRSRLHIVRMGVDLEAFPPLSADRANRAQGPLRVLFVGRLVPEKGLFVLLDAVARVEAQAPNTITLHIVGVGPLQAVIDQEISRRRMSHYVTTLGPLGQDELPAQYAWADCLCLPSFAEGLPVVLMEAMASELPVVTTHIAGIPELVDDGVNGYLVPPGQPARLAVALQDLADSERRRAFGQAGRSTVESQFVSACNARALAAILAEQPAAQAAG